MNQIHKKLEDAQYRSIDALSATMLKTLTRSPYHLRDSLDNKKDPTPEMLFGTAVHTRVLEPHRFAEMFVESPKFDRRTTAGKEAALKFESENEGKHRLDPDDMNILNSMVANIESEFGTILASCDKEISVVVDDPDVAGLVLKGRFDMYDEKTGIIYDLKTCQGCDYNSFVRDVFKNNYALQSYHYEFIAKAAGMHFTKVVFIPTEKKEPYLCAQYPVEFDPTFVHLWKERHLALRKLWQSCKVSGEYLKPSQLPHKPIIIK